jgi:large subunit ribosomal protein L21
MYAIILDGKQQYKVEEGQELDISFREMEKGAQITFDRVLAYRDESGLRVGRPVLAAASVTAEVVSGVLGPKLVIQKFRRRKNYRRKTGHRQLYTRVKVTKINPGE